MRRLKDLKIHEISLVKRAANKRKFLITKNMGEPMSTPDLEKIRDSLLSVPEPILKAVDAVAKGTFAKDDTTMTLSDDQGARLKAAGRMLQPVIGDVPMAAIAQMLAAIGAQGTDALMDSDLADNVDADDALDAAAVGDADETAGEEAAQATADAAEDAQAAADVDAADALDAADPVVVVAPKVKKDSDKEICMAKAQAKSREVYAQMMKEGGWDEDGDELEGEAMPPEGASVKKSESILKSAGLSNLPAHQRDALETIFKSHKDAAAASEQRASEAIAKSAALQLKLDTQEMIQKAQELPHLGGAKAMTDMLLRSKQKDPEGFEEHFKVMKTWNDTLNKSDLFVEHGTQATAPEGDVEARISAGVAALVQKSGGMSDEQAYTHYITKTPEGRAQYGEYLSKTLDAKGH